MNKKIVLSVFVILIAIAASFGATLAWFTATDDAPENVFQAGSVEISADEQSVLFEEKMLNVNPGDCFVKCFRITNTGSKAIELRLKDFAGEWGLEVQTLNTPVGPYPNSPIFIAPQPYKNDSNQWVSDWVMKYDDTTNGFDFYYKGGPIPGTYVEPGETPATWEERTVWLCVLVVFDGPEMDNKYQGATYELNGSFEAVQSSNDAPDQAWADADWNIWRGANGGWFSMDYVAALREGTTGPNLIPGFPYPASDRYTDYADYFIQNVTNIICLTNGGGNGGGPLSGETAYAGEVFFEAPAARGGWWRYFDTNDGATQNVYAGNDSVEIGTATISAPDIDSKVTITIDLDAGWQLKDVNNSVKIGGFNEAPTSFTPPGQLRTERGNQLVFTGVDSYQYYVIHLDVEQSS